MAATMFREFSFDPVARPACGVHEAERAAMDVSPTSSPPTTSSPYERRPTPPPCTMGDLAAQLNQQTLGIDASYASGPPSPPSDHRHYHHQQQHPQQNKRPTYSRVAASLLRMQRQSNSRMQCSASHLRDMSALVRMIEDEEQCTMTESKSRTLSSSSASSVASSSTVPDDAEALDMAYGAPARELAALLGLQPWPSKERRDSCIRVTKTLRMRRRAGNGVQKRTRS